VLLVALAVTPPLLLGAAESHALPPRDARKGHTAPVWQVIASPCAFHSARQLP
jgi:hypothetical protein